MSHACVALFSCILCPSESCWCGSAALHESFIWCVGGNVACLRDVVGFVCLVHLFNGQPDCDDV